MDPPSKRSSRRTLETFCLLGHALHHQIVMLSCWICHKNDVIHCDIKKLLSWSNRGDMSISAIRTAAPLKWGHCLGRAGTPAYMAPEKILVRCHRETDYMPGVLLSNSLPGTSFRGTEKGTENRVTQSKERYRFAQLKLPPRPPLLTPQSNSPHLLPIVLRALIRPRLPVFFWQELCRSCQAYGTRPGNSWPIIGFQSQPNSCAAMVYPDGRISLVCNPKPPLCLLVSGCSGVWWFFILSWAIEVQMQIPGSTVISRRNFTSAQYDQQWTACRLHSNKINQMPGSNTP